MTAESQAPEGGPELSDEQISSLWDGHVVPVFGKNGINPIVFARAVIKADRAALAAQSTRRRDVSISAAAIDASAPAQPAPVAPSSAELLDLCHKHAPDCPTAQGVALVSAALAAQPQQGPDLCPSSGLWCAGACQQDAQPKPVTPEQISHEWRRRVVEAAHGITQTKEQP